MTKSIVFLAGLGVLAVPLTSLATTYRYAARDGTIRDVQAASAIEALAMVSASGDAAIHSGVALDTGVLEPGDSIGHEYAYVSVSGALASVTAANLDTAFALASDRAPTSGFLVNPR